MKDKIFIRRKLNGIINKELIISKGQLTLDKCFKDFDADEFDIVYTIIDIEDTFNIHIENDKISETTTLQEIVDLIYNKLNN